MAALQAVTSGDTPKDTSIAVSLSPAYRLLLTQRLLGIIAHDTYASVADFEWVISVLVDVTYVSHVDVGVEVRNMLLDVVGRVKSVRQYAVGVLEKVLADGAIRERGRDGTGEEAVVEAAVWICGEYSR
jgi:AP-3 complex subunit delta-1